MGTLNELDFVINNHDLVQGPILEIGSKDYGNTNNFRQYFADKEYVGMDMEAGKGVDVVCDFTDDYNVLKHKLGDRKFKTIICLCVFEHCKNPFLMAENIDRFLEKKGVLFLSTPFVWNIHAYPNDYWRFTPATYSLLFPNYSVLQEKSYYTTKIRGEHFSLDTSIDSISFLKPTFLTFLLKKIHFIKFQYPYALVPANINAILVKK